MAKNEREKLVEDFYNDDYNNELELEESKLSIAIKTIGIVILTVLLLSGIGFVTLKICRWLIHYLPEGEGINLFVSYGLLFAYLICAVTVLIISIYRFINFKVNGEDILSFDDKKHKLKNTASIVTLKAILWIFRILMLVFIIPFTVFTVFLIIALGALVIFTFSGYPLLGFSIMCFGVCVCSVVVLILVFKYLYFTYYFKEYEDKTKYKLAKISAIFLVIGFVVFGVGFGVYCLERNYIKYEDGVLANTVVEEFNLSFPQDGSTLYYKDSGIYKSFKVTEDESVSLGSIKYVVSHSKYYSDVEPNITRDFYLYDKDNMYISEHRVNFLGDVSYDYDYDSSNDTREFFANLKNKTIVNKGDNKMISVEIKINPNDKEKFVELTGNKMAITYRDYVENYKAKDSISENQ
ncbi:MAG: hypothetical protein ACI4VF_08740 [Lachnospirales bacterium]